MTDHDPPPEFSGSALRRARGIAGMTQIELCERSGVSIYTLRGYEQGRDTNPTADTLTRLAHTLRCPIGEFFQAPASDPLAGVAS